MFDHELNRCREFDIKRFTIMRRDDAGLVLEHEMFGITDNCRVHVDLVVGRRVHEDEIVTVAVQILHVALVDVGRFDLDARIEGLFDDLARKNVLHLGSDESRALPNDPGAAEAAIDHIEHIAHEEQLDVLGWRDLPVSTTGIGKTALGVMPALKMLFVQGHGAKATGLDLERLEYCLRKRAEHDVAVYFPSLSSRTLVYKGMLTTAQVKTTFLDLTDPRMKSAIALVHSRFSTNTFPSWPLAHPYRLIAHNGEINTVKGNRNWMRAREAMLTSDAFGDLSRIFPIVTDGGSDSASFDEVLELLHLGGRSLPHAVLMMIPEAWENHAEMEEARRAFYEFHSNFMEPWDGPANISFTDGTVIGSVLDRNGLRPGRFWVTDDGLVVLASETGVLDIDQSKIVRKGRLQPGRMFLIDTVQGRLIDDEEVKAEIVSRKPYRSWVTQYRISLDELPEPLNVPQPDHPTTRQRQQAFGYTQEDLAILLAPMGITGQEAVGSMGDDTPLALLSENYRGMHHFFRQNFSQVSNPAIDPLRERRVMSLRTRLGNLGNVLAESEEQVRILQLSSPVLSNAEFEAMRGYMGETAVAIDCTFDAQGGETALRAALAREQDDETRTLIADALRAEHRVVSVERHALDAVRRVARARRDE